MATESPIEELLVRALCEEVPKRHRLIYEGRIFGSGAYEIAMSTNQRQGRYKIDILLTLEEYAVLAIECDGHKFHDRTKEQAIHDRLRDRRLLHKDHITTIRFTGSEIFGNARLCAIETYMTLFGFSGIHSRMYWTGMHLGRWGAKIAPGGYDGLLAGLVM